MPKTGLVAYMFVLVLPHPKERENYCELESV
uniref:Uncharacterized protein n=1 Tax=Arundo donax TaxID=35708 RepID=A0A0A9C326_ARUDO